LRSQICSWGRIEDGLTAAWLRRFDTIVAQHRTAESDE
jgi:hypothetical protein